MKKNYDRLLMNERDRYGVIATMINAAGKRTSRAFYGFPRQALLDLCTWIDMRADDGWKVECLSSPMTIYTDLQGKREASYPEVLMLGQVGRADVLAC